MIIFNTLFNLTLVIVLSYCYLHENKFIEFEQRIYRKFFKKQDEADKPVVFTGSEILWVEEL